METKIPNNLFENTLLKVYNEKLNLLNKQIEESEDAFFVKNRFLNLIQKEYKTLENKLLPINLTLYVDARNKVKETKGKNLEKALTEVLKENKISTIIKGITSIATLLAYKNFIDDLINKIPNEENIIILESKPDEKKIKKVTNNEFTLNRQILAITYLLKKSGIKNIDHTTTARFIQFITNRETNITEIKNTRIYRELRNTLAKQKQTPKDMDYVVEQFKKLGLENIVNELNKAKT
jgi:hypothetical protein